MITYEKISLFDTSEGSILVHACNAQGIWGSGIAMHMKERFPVAFKKYNETCENKIGSYDSTYDIDTTTHLGHRIISLITSKDFGQNVDSVEEILINTTTALNEFCKNNMISQTQRRTIYSNKFNSGLFKVPWEKTEAILKILTNRYNIHWIVCDPNLEEK